MPEGDTIHRTAARLRPALVGQELVDFRAPRLRGDRPRLGETIESVEAAGKHLLIAFSGGLTLETHMKMTGSWHLYRTGERWRKSPGAARVIIDVDGWVAVCFSAPVVQTAPTGRSGRADLGPDLCVDATDIDEVIARIPSFVTDDTEVADVLLDQRVGSGIGNVYKSETCWFERVDPFAPIGSLDTAARRALFARAATLLQANLGPGARTTVPGGLAVYDRAGRACRVCSTPIERRAQGQHARSTYWCPRCQPATRA